MALAGIDALTAEDVAPAAEPDPLEESPAAPRNVSARSDKTSVVDDADAETQLFGELWPLEAKVKLDPTVDRARFRRQKEPLKKLSYQFQPLGQYWEKPLDEEVA